MDDEEQNAMLSEQGRSAKDKFETVPRWAVNLARDMHGLEESMAKMRGDISSLKLTSESNSRTLRGYNGEKGVLARLERVESSLTMLSTDVRETCESVSRIEQRTFDVISGDSTQSFKYLTWQWLIEKLGAPIIIAAAGFFLFTLCPALIILVRFLPDIMKMIGLGTTP